MRLGSKGHTKSKTRQYHISCQSQHYLHLSHLRTINPACTELYPFHAIVLSVTTSLHTDAIFTPQAIRRVFYRRALAAKCKQTALGIDEPYLFCLHTRSYIRGPFFIHVPTWRRADATPLVMPLGGFPLLGSIIPLQAVRTSSAPRTRRPRCHQELRSGEGAIVLNNILYLG